MIFIGDVLVCALWAVQNVPYMVVIGDVFVYVAQNIHPGGCTTYMVAFQDDFVFAFRAAQNILYMIFIVLVFAIVKRFVFFLF